MRRRKDRKQVDIASRTSSKNRQLDGDYLEGTESSVGDIAPTEGTGFSEAWAQTVDEDSDSTLDSALNVGQDDSRARDLDRSRTGTYLGIAGFLVGIAVIAFFATQAATEPDPNLGARATDDTARNVLSSPLAEREYSDLVSPVSVTEHASLNEGFVDSSGNGSLVPDLGAVGDRQISFGPVFWAGRTHIAVLGADAVPAAEGECLITALVAEDLQAIDVAGVGECDEAFAATGDRIACASDNVVLIEVWPFNPDSVTEPRTVAAVRTRLEQRDGAAVTSLRGSLTVNDSGGVSPLVSAATTLEGRPGDVVTIELDGLSGECSLVDRSTVDVRLLPG